MKKTLLASTILLILAAAAVLRADVVTTNGTGSSFAFTNAQDNAVWTPTALVVSVPSPVTVSLLVYRDGNGVSALLASNDLQNVTHVVWTPPADILFPKGTGLRLVSSNTGQFTIQLHRRAAE